MGKLVFAVNGERFEPTGVDPSTTLLEFLRTQTRFKGPKLGCGEGSPRVISRFGASWYVLSSIEDIYFCYWWIASIIFGGCGACVVLLSRYDPINDRVEDCSINSCLTLLYSINLCSVTTTEGLGNSKDGFHSIHKRLSGFHASQCGFCTPGMCMSIFSALVNADKTARAEPAAGFSKLSVAEAEKAIAGNICRCTGYRPIVDASKSFASDVDIEDLGLNTFWSKWVKNANVDTLPPYRSGEICTFPDFLKTEIKSSLNQTQSVANDIKSNHASVTEGCWYHPESVNELFDLLGSGQCSNEYDVKLVVGNTGSGVYKDRDIYKKYIDLSGISELSVIKKDNEGIEIGAAVTIAKAIEVLKEENGRLVFDKIANHMEKVASQFVRNTASLGGNIIMAQRSRFPSDIATILLAAGSSVSIQRISERLVLTLEEFLASPPCDQRTLLLSIWIPHWNSVSNSVDSNEHMCSDDSAILFETYRASPRPLGNAVAYLNSAFLAQVSFSKNSSEHILENLQLAFGAYGCEHAIRARRVEKFLTGKKVTAAVLNQAIKLLRETIVPEEGTSSPSYRSSLAVAFLFKFLYPLAKGPSSENHNDNINGNLNSSVDKSSKNGYLAQLDHHDLLLSSHQVVGFNKDYLPVGEPTRKAGAELQASGEALFVDDIPSPKECLYGAFIYGTKPMAHVKGIRFEPTQVSQKVITVISSKDIPNGNNNLKSVLGSERLFVDSHTEYAGHPIGLVIAETQKFANLAAGQAVVEYGPEMNEPPILTVEEAVKRSSFFTIPPYFIPKQVGDLTAGMAEADHKILSAELKLGSQYHFYMEPQTVFAVPDEDNCMVVYSSNQSPHITQCTIANCLGVPQHNVRVITRRVGGGFGGKTSKAMAVATACAFAAFKLQRPVRMYLDRKTDMIIAGGRHPMKINYSVGFKSDGKITALHVDMLIEAGISEDISTMMPLNIIAGLKKYNWGAFSFDAKVCKTNTPSRTAMRGPGELQGSYIAEAIVEHVASVLSLDTNSVRKKNLHTWESLQLFYEQCTGDAFGYTLPSIFDNLASSENYVCRVQMIQEFNSCNKWRKRGISCVPIVFKSRLRPTPGKVGILNDGSIVVEVGGIELGQGLWTKVKQMAAFALGQLNIGGRHDLLERVRVVQADSLSLIQGGFTGGSTTSETSCEAVRLACNILVDRLRHVKDKLQEQLGLLTWDTLIAQANLQAVNLSASTYYVADRSSMDYLNFGAATSEVEIDLLTGATTILRTDITYDCGQSLNPAVDLGQIEGAFVQGIGFFMQEEYLWNSDGLVVSDGTWTYKVPTVDTIPKKFNVEILNSGHHQKCVLSSKASGEPPLLLAASVHCATREAIKAARSEFLPEGSASMFQLPVPATMPVVKELCGLDIVERYLEADL